MNMFLLYTKGKLIKTFQVPFYGYCSFENAIQGFFCKPAHSHNEFISRFQNLCNFGNPILYVEQIYNSRFINKYGTHYISEAKMGSYYVEQSLLSRNSYLEMALNGIDIELYAGFSAIASINPLFNYNKTEAETFQG